VYSAGKSSECLPKRRQLTGMYYVLRRPSPGRIQGRSGRGTKAWCIRPPCPSGEGATIGPQSGMYCVASIKRYNCLFTFLSLDFSFPITFISQTSSPHADPFSLFVCSGRPAWSTRRNHLLRPQTLKLQRRLSLPPPLSVLPLQLRLLSPQKNIPPELNFRFKQMYGAPLERYREVV
jgi:hypothetical protein